MFTFYRMAGLFCVRISFLLISFIRRQVDPIEFFEVVQRANTAGKMVLVCRWLLPMCILWLLISDIQG